MRASKEAIAGTLAALDLRMKLDLPEWQAAQQSKLARFLAAPGRLTGARTLSEPG